MWYLDPRGKTLAGRQVPVAYALPGGPLLLDGPVVSGFGRGSRQMGVPTANIDPVPLQGTLADMPLGVYFGCARFHLCSQVAVMLAHTAATMLRLPALMRRAACRFGELDSR